MCFLKLGNSWATVAAQVPKYAQEHSYCFQTLCDSCVKVATGKLSRMLRSKNSSTAPALHCFALKVLTKFRITVTCSYL